MCRKSVLGIAILFSVLLLFTFPVKPQIRKVKGPAVVAKVDRSFWIGSVNTKTGFDKASRASILLYALKLEEMKTLSDGRMLAAFNIRSLNRASVNKWLEKELRLSLQNYAFAAKTCPSDDWSCVGNVTDSNELISKARALAIPANLNVWKENFSDFVENYLNEQLRLAALFPKTSSEIDMFNEFEWNGDTLGDRSFYLTFDDGPTTASGNTDDVLEMLAANKKTAVFFVLGGNFQNRLNTSNASKITNLYQGQCVAMHGWEHQSHAKWTLWQSSITRSQTLLKTTFGNSPDLLPLFRPPYGQRTADSGAFFQEKGLQVALWNLDSQDWNAQVNAEDIINRMLTLMLIKRHGILLFHDVHPKAKIALPVIFEELGDSVLWGECHRIADL